MFKKILGLKEKILDILFPVHCLNCGKAALPHRSLSEGGGWVCGDCLGFVNFEGVFLCPRCGDHTYIGRACKRCVPPHSPSVPRQVGEQGEIEGVYLNKSYLNGLVAMGKYSDKFLQKLIKSLKFQYITDLESVFDKLVKRFCLKYSAVFPQNAIIVPVPLHPLRLRERGFNQAEYIAKFINGALGYEISNVLQRIRYTYRQSELPKEMREKNIRGAFKYCHSESPDQDREAKNLAGAERPLAEILHSVQDDNFRRVPEIIILVDDVYTSGGTMQECAKTLKEAGAKEVWGFVLARG